MKLVINECYGGFGLSEKARKMLNVDSDFNIKRTDPNLVAVVETLGKEANDEYSELAVVELPDDITDWTIDEYDGSETVIYVQNGKLYFK